MPSSCFSLTTPSDRLPTAIVDIRLQLPTNHTRYSMLEPDGAQESIVALLMQEQLPPMPETRIHFTILVDVGRDHPRARQVVQVEDGAFADVDEEANITLASEGVRFARSGYRG